MKLIGFNYKESSSSGEPWRVEDLTFSDFNLIVGRNATGKSRLLRSIVRSAAAISGEDQSPGRKFEFEVRFDEDFPEANLDWARRLQYFPFAGEMLFKRSRSTSEVRLAAAELFKLGSDTFGDIFQERVLQHIVDAGYSISEITQVDRGPGARSLEFKESKRRTNTALRHLSQAQQRITIFFVYLTFLELDKRPATILVDDFAEGLDFEHSAKLAKKILRDYANLPLQFIVATNDRYVMNVVPLERWTVLVEEGETTRVFNYHNSKQKFDEFKFTGLSNFDFFSMDFAGGST